MFYRVGVKPGNVVLFPFSFFQTTPKSRWMAFPKSQRHGVEHWKLLNKENCRTQGKLPKHRVRAHAFTNLVAQMVKNLPAVQEIQVPSLRRIPWSRKWQPTPVFLPGESPGHRSLAGYSPWGRKESDVTEQITPSLSLREASGTRPNTHPPNPYHIQCL